MPYHCSSVARNDVPSYATLVVERNTVFSSTHGETTIVGTRTPIRS